MAAEANMTEPSLAPEPSIPNVKHGFWADHEHHPYHRLSVEKYVQEFCGWPALKKLMDCIDDDVKKNFFICLFLTGGRVSECLVFRKNNFDVKRKEGVILVNDMRLLKRYTHDKNNVYLDAQGKQHSRTARLYETRKAFVIKRSARA